MVAFIPTKSRFKTKTYKLFESVGINVYHFIEPQEYELYNVPNKINIGQNNKGVSYVRNFMLSYAKDKDYDWVIFCDDDVSSFGIYDVKTKKTIKKDASVWFEIYKKAKNLPFELVGLNYRQYAWTQKKSYSINNRFAEV